MGLIIKEHTVTGTRRNDTVRALYDTGAGLSCVRRDIAEILGETHTRPTPMRFMAFDGQEGASTDQTIDLDIDINGTILRHTFYVMDDLAEEIIIGADIMQTWKISLDMENETVSIDPRILFLNLRI